MCTSFVEKLICINTFASKTNIFVIKSECVIVVLRCETHMKTPRSLPYCIMVYQYVKHHQGYGITFR